MGLIRPVTEAEWKGLIHIHNNETSARDPN